MSRVKSSQFKSSQVKCQLAGQDHAPRELWAWPGRPHALWERARDLSAPLRACSGAVWKPGSQVGDGREHWQQGRDAVHGKARRGGKARRADAQHKPPEPHQRATVGHWPDSRSKCPLPWLWTVPHAPARCSTAAPVQFRAPPRRLEGLPWHPELASACSQDEAFGATFNHQSRSSA